MASAGEDGRAGGPSVSDRLLPILRASETRAASVVAERGSAARLMTVALYTLAFFGALPWALWRLGGGFDRWFLLAVLPSGTRFPLAAALGLVGLPLMLRAA